VKTRKRKQYDPAKDNPLLGEAALLIVGAVAGVAGVGYVVYKMVQPSPSASPSKDTPAPSKSASPTPKITPAKSLGSGVIPSSAPSVVTSDPATSTPPSTLLMPGQTLKPGDFILSPSGAYKLIFQTDGNFVLYGKDSSGQYTNVIWSTSTQNKGATTVIMQTDGNCVLYVGTAAAWATNTAGNPGAYLALADDGIIAVYTAANLTSYNSDNALWASTWPQ
jgi:hypothetical protein